MATPIRDTPVLYGEDARRFIENMNNPKKIAPERLKEMRENYERMKRCFVETEKVRF